MINIISGKTLYELQLENGTKKGLGLFATRCTGNTTGKSLEIMGQLMQGKQEVVDLKLSEAEIKHYIAERIDQMGLVGFKLDGDKLSYYPFKEHQDVKTIVREVEVKVSPYDGEMVAPRSYRVVQHIERPKVHCPSLEEGYGKVCRTFS